MLSAVILCRNEADRLEAALASVAFADERLVLDSGSKDGSPELAERMGAKVIRTDWPGFLEQRRRSFSMAQGDWVLSMDADERLSPGLQQQIQQELQAPRAQGYRLDRCNYWLGHRLKHGHWYPDRQLRLVQKQQARWEGSIHEQLLVQGKVTDLEGELSHIPYRNLAEHFSTIDRYTSLAAQELRSQGRTAGSLELIGRPLWRFFAGYLLKGGFLDGPPGLVVAGMDTLYSAVKWARVAGVLPMEP